MNYNNRTHQFIERGYLFYVVMCIETFIIVFLLYCYARKGIRYGQVDTINLKVSYKRSIAESFRRTFKNRKQVISSTQNIKNARTVRDNYFVYIVSEIEKHKIYPSKERYLNHEDQVLLQLILSRNGTVCKIIIKNKPQYQCFADSAIKTIQKALPFRPFPAEISEDVLSIPIKIRYSLQ